MGFCGEARDLRKDECDRFGFVPLCASGLRIRDILGAFDGQAL